MDFPPLPDIPGHRHLAALPPGPCGEAYLLQTDEGEPRVLKRLRPLAINRLLLSRSCQRLLEEEAVPGLVRIVEARFDARPPWILAEAVGRMEDGDWVSSSLATLELGGLKLVERWEIVEKLATALAHLHRLGIPHCNLKPSNILIREDNGLEPVVTDFSLGWIGGIYALDPGEDLLYAPREQLLHPQGVDHGEWSHWDVFSFGMLAFRLLTGRFPRNHERRAAWEGGLRSGRAGLSAAELAKLDEGASVPDWGGAAVGWEEAERRQIIDTCLALDPDVRYGDMREVEAAFSQIAEERALRAERERVMQLRRREMRKLAVARAAAAGSAIAFLTAAFFGLVQFRDHREARDQIARLEASLDRLVGEKEAEIRELQEDARRRERAAIEQAAGVRRENTVFRETLTLSQEQADKLFAMLRDRKPVTHPGFQGRDEMIAELEQFYSDFVEKIPATGGGFEVERARAHDNLGELAIERGEDEAAAAWFRLAVAGWESLAAAEPTRGQWRARLGRATLRLSQLDFAAGRTDGAVAGAARARGLFEELAEAEPHTLDHSYALAATRLHQGRLARQQGQLDEAFAEYRAATDILSKLTERTGRFDFRSELAHGYVELGEMARVNDDLERAGSVQQAALVTLLDLVKERPECELPRFDLARAWGELGEIEAQGGNNKSALELIGKSLDLLEELLAENPSQGEYLYHQGRRLGALARIHRDEGRRVEAEAMIERAAALYQRLSATNPENPYYTYQLALTLWQRAELMGDLRKTAECVQLTREAGDMLASLAERDDLEPAQLRQIEESAAYLKGDLAHLLEQDERPAEALAVFKLTLAKWRTIAGKYGEDAMTVDAIQWARRRIAELESAELEE